MKGRRLHVAREQGLGEAHHADDVGEILFLQLGAFGGRFRNAGAFVDAGFHLLQRHLGIGGNAQPQRILRFARARKVLAIILIDRAQIGAELVAHRRTGNEPAVQERAVVIEAAVRVLRIGLDQLGRHQPAIGGAVDERALGLGDAGDEEFARVVGIGRGHLHAIAFAPVARCHPAEAALDLDRIFGKIALAARRRRRIERGPAMGEDDEIAVPALRHRREHIGAALELRGVAGGDLRHRFGAGRRFRQRGFRRVLRKGRSQRHNTGDQSQRVRSGTAHDRAPLAHGAITLRLYQGWESQLSTFSVPSNSAAMRPPPAR